MDVDVNSGKRAGRENPAVSLIVAFRPHHRISSASLTFPFSPQCDAADHEAAGICDGAKCSVGGVERLDERSQRGDSDPIFRMRHEAEHLLPRLRCEDGNSVAVAVR
jgi:hypothetical protein